MTIIEALKKFYEGNAYNEQELKEADNVLDVIRAKYGPYEGANIAEYLQTAMANGVTPGSGGDGGDYKVFKVTINADPVVESSQYYVDIEEKDDEYPNTNYAGVFVRGNGFFNYSPFAGGDGESSIVVDLICFGDSVSKVYLPSQLTASSGDIAYDSETGYYTISGDCSVTGWLDD